MKKLYKDGAECTANDDQIEIMEKVGWSQSAPEEDVKKSEKDEVINDEPEKDEVINDEPEKDKVINDEPEKSEETAKPAAKKISRAKPIKKSSAKE